MHHVTRYVIYNIKDKKFKGKTDKFKCTKDFKNAKIYNQINHAKNARNLFDVRENNYKIIPVETILMDEVI